MAETPVEPLDLTLHFDSPDAADLKAAAERLHVTPEGFARTAIVAVARSGPDFGERAADAGAVRILERMRGLLPEGHRPIHWDSPDAWILTRFSELLYGRPQSGG